MTTELEPSLRAWLSARAPSDVPSELLHRVNAIPGATRRAPSRWIRSFGATRHTAAPRVRTAWAAIVLVALLTAAVVAIAIVGASPSPISYQGVFTPGPGMDGPRGDHTATLLDDGRVLIAGGTDGSEPGLLRTAAIYDPSTGQFDSTGPMTAARAYHSAVRLDDGRVLIVGGAGEPSAELFDPDTGTFTPTGAPTGAWEGARPISLPDGRVLFVGIGGPEAAVFEPATASFATIPIPDPGYGPTAALLADGHRVLIVAGQPPGDPTPGASSPAWVLDMSDGTVTPTGRLRYATIDPLEPDIEARPRREMSAVVLGDGRVLIVGGYAKTCCPYPTDAADLYDPSSGRFEPTGSLRIARVGASVSQLSDGRVLITGGDTWDGESHNMKVPVESSTDGAEIYDPATGTFELTGTMTEARSGHTATLLEDGRVLLAGGFATGGRGTGGMGRSGPARSGLSIPRNSSNSTGPTCTRRSPSPRLRGRRSRTRQSTVWDCGWPTDVSESLRGDDLTKEIPPDPPAASSRPTPSQYAAWAAFRQPVRRYKPERCWRAVVSLMPSS